MPHLHRILEPEAMDTADEASSYDAMDHAEANDALVDRLAELGAPGQVLDIGTGPGHIPLLVCERFPGCRVTAVDLSREMLKIADRRRAASPFADRITFQCADAKRLPFADDRFDTVLSNTILHHIPDPRPFLAEAFRLLKPGGILLIRDLYRPESIERLNELVERHTEGATDHQRKMFADSLHAALTPGELRTLADEAGLGEAEIVIDTDRHMSLQSVGA